MVTWWIPLLVSAQKLVYISWTLYSWVAYTSCVWCQGLSRQRRTATWRRSRPTWRMVWTWIAKTGISSLLSSPLHPRVILTLWSTCWIRLVLPLKSSRGETRKRSPWTNTLLTAKSRVYLNPDIWTVALYAEITRLCVLMKESTSSAWCELSRKNSIHEVKNRPGRKTTTLACSRLCFFTEKCSTRHSQAHLLDASWAKGTVYVAVHVPGKQALPYNVDLFVKSDLQRMTEATLEFRAVFRYRATGEQNRDTCPCGRESLREAPIRWKRKFFPLLRPWTSWALGIKFFGQSVWPRCHKIAFDKEACNVSCVDCPHITTCQGARKVRSKCWCIEGLNNNSLYRALLSPQAVQSVTSIMC